MMMSVLVMLCVFSMCLQAVHSQEQPLCAADEWKCGDDNCIKIGNRCNGEDDCSDGSDEKNCTHWKCPSIKWKCSNGLCVYLDWRCDGKDNCGDNSDENNCDTWRCDESIMWKCNSSNQCTWLDLRCNGDPHCDDKSDEQNCAQWQCPKTTWACANRSRCIWRERRCDGRVDCQDGSDEEKCEQWTCPVNTWKCNNQRCIPTSMRCDGTDQCGDGSDEQDCEQWACPDGYWQCSNRQCTRSEGLCDGHRFGQRDCRDGSDEDHCATIPPTTPSQATPSPSTPSPASLSPATLSPATPGEVDTLTMGAIAGIVVGGLLFAFLLVLITVMGIRKIKFHRKDTGTSRLHNTDNPSPQLASRAVSHRPHHPEPQSSCEEHAYENMSYNTLYTRDTHDVLQQDQPDDGRIYTELVTSPPTARDTYIELVGKVAGTDDHETT
ncbi:very low-density lipoprotein receptor-like isoform X2 [Littorina saxatilis]|uniref:very low-density lipoprotein receptor-like isoform X2 n=1 Tax=Littorina saxatilis TaxID=31220 RepID=UPI0038B607C2